MHFYKRYHKKKKEIDIDAGEIAGYLETRNIKFLKIFKIQRKKLFFIYVDWGKRKKHVAEKSKLKGYVSTIYSHCC